MVVLACTPHPGLGSVSVTRGARVTVVDLATCKETVAHRRFVVPGLTAPGSRLVYRGRTLAATRHGWGIVALGLSPDRRWAFYMVDPFDSASILNDGLPVRVVSTDGGRSHTLPTMLLDDQYWTWCGGTLVLTAGEDRIAWHDKRLVVTSPPDWTPRSMLRSPGRAWGASTCAPDGRSVAVQSQRSSIVARPSAGRWAIWRVTLAGRATQLTHPPVGDVDGSPRYAADGTLRGDRLTGPLLSLGYSPGWFGRWDWPYAVTR